MWADAVGAQAQQQVAATVEHGQRGGAVRQAGIGQLARGAQIQLGVTWQLRRGLGGSRHGEAQEQGSAKHGEGSRRQAVTVASGRGQKPHNLMTGL
ncbi:hypothetical protein [Pseudomonas sp. 31 R 17]|nr:hypothetical protein [Pseudomonas sp. 31 R 17]